MHLLHSCRSWQAARCLDLAPVAQLQKVAGSYAYRLFFDQLTELAFLLAGAYNEAAKATLSTNQLSTREGLEQGYCVVAADKRFLLLFTFLKKNLNKQSCFNHRCWCFCTTSLLHKGTHTGCTHRDALTCTTSSCSCSLLLEGQRICVPSAVVAMVGATCAQARNVRGQGQELECEQLAMVGAACMQVQGMHRQGQERESEQVAMRGAAFRPRACCMHSEGAHPVLPTHAPRHLTGK